MAETKTPRMSEADARKIAEAACPNNPAERELVVKEQMGTISDDERKELSRIRSLVF